MLPTVMFYFLSSTCVHGHTSERVQQIINVPLNYAKLAKPDPRVLIMRTALRFEVGLPHEVGPYYPFVWRVVQQCWLCCERTSRRAPSTVLQKRTLLRQKEIFKTFGSMSQQWRNYYKESEWSSLPYIVFDDRKQFGWLRNGYRIK